MIGNCLRLIGIVIVKTGDTYRTIKIADQNYVFRRIFPGVVGFLEIILQFFRSSSDFIEVSDSYGESILQFPIRHRFNILVII